MTTSTPASTPAASGGTNAAVIANLNKQAAAAAQANASNNNALTNGSNSSAKGLASNLNMFLTMLTTQLKNQDPLSPTDSTQFTNQLVLYSQVEQQINTNGNLGKLITLQGNNQQASAIGYIGQTVSVSGTSLPLQGGTAAFDYTLPSAAQSAVVNIKDSAGTTVAQLTGKTTAGTHYLSWNGQNSQGTQLADGHYTIEVLASDSKGNTLTTTSNTFGKVTGVSSDATNGTSLDLGAVTTPLSGINAIVDLTTINNDIKAGT
jgi:flagellar basal-body rod modification protein FlgD